ncbi:MAG: glycosyltransferase [Candidatus Saccharibacteria bacterium]|nr:glycosyltransferase [Candidatus Saccharibacteria bacterium]
MNKLISVIIPVYNSEKTIGRCADSLSFQSDENFEVIFVNDGSPDKSGEILEKYCAKDKRFKLITTKNFGAAAARNTGIEKSSGEYICFVDSDDIVSPNYLSKMRELLGDGVDAVCTKYARNKEDNFESIKETGETLSGKDAVDALLSMKIDNGPVAKLFTRKAIGDVRMPDTPVAEDLYFNYEVFTKAKKVVTNDSILYSYIEAKDSLSTKKFSAERMKSLEIVQKIDEREHSFLSMARVFMEAYFICEQIVTSKVTEEYSEEYKKVCSILEKNRKEILNNSSATMRQRLIAASLKFGPKFTVRMTTAKGAIRRKMK